MDEEIYVHCAEGCLIVTKGKAVLLEDDCDGAGHSRGGSDPKPIDKEWAKGILSEVERTDPRQLEKVSKAWWLLRQQ